MGEYSNHTKVGVGEGLEGGEMVRWAIRKGWDIFPSFGGLNKQRKNQNRESNGAWSLDGHQLQQPIERQCW
jgi:hypothetical protein